MARNPSALPLPLERPWPLRATPDHNVLGVIALQRSWQLNKKREALPKSNGGKSFDGIQLAVAGIERPDLPRRFAICAACRAGEVSRAAQGEPSRLPKQLTLADLDEVACEPVGAEIQDEVRMCL